MHGEEMIVAIMIPLSFFLLVFGIVYMYKKENLALIEKGINPKVTYNRPAPFRNLKWALLLIGSGAGLLLAFLIDEFLLMRTGTYVSDGVIRHYREGENPPVYFGLIAIGGGLGLFGSYKMERKWYEENKTVVNDKI
jgi:hypothetical protein